MLNVRYWPKADIEMIEGNDRFWPKADIPKVRQAIYVHNLGGDE